MFARTVLAVSVLRRKSKKQKSKRDNKDLVTPIISEIDTFEHLQIEKRNKLADRLVKIDAFENNYHADAKMDSNVSGGEKPLLKNSLEKNSLGLAIDQNIKLDNEVCLKKINELVNKGDANLVSFTNPSINFDHMIEEPENKDMIQSELRSGDQNTTNSPVDSNKYHKITRSHSLPALPALSSSLNSNSESTSQQSLHHYHSNTFPLYKSTKNTNTNIKYNNNNGLQITGTKIMITNDNEPVNKEISHSSLPTENEIFVDPYIAEGTFLIKVSSKKKQQRKFRIDVDQGRILWDSKKSKSGKVNIENIKELRIGEAIRNYRVHFKISSDFEDRWFTIIYVEEGKYKTLHLVADTADLFNRWVDNLERLYLHRKDMVGGLGNLRKRQSIWLKQHWKQANKDGGDVLEFDELARLCRQLNINMSRQSLKTKFDEADEGKNGWLSFYDFQRFVKIIKNRKELVFLFESLSKTRKGVLTSQEFKDFLINIQKFNLKEEDYDKLYYKFCDKGRNETNKGHNEMNLEGFNSFLMSSDNPIFAPDHAKVYQEMSLPLNHYFIYSSHNTYLLGHQLTGESSIEGYIRVLQRGCRCVEIDCWDGPDGPIITHGRTLTSKILFQDAIAAIRTYAFKASPWPLILSLEVHCSVEQQNQMASILVAILGEQLVTKFFFDNETELPSPEKLMYRILLKGKNLPSGASEDSFDSATDTESAESDVEQSKDHIDKKKNSKKKSVAKALSDLVIYCSSVKFKGFEYHRDRSMFYHMSSFSERFANRLSKADKQSFIHHNSRHLSRVYPTGLRITSSNYEPYNQWMVGIQMVALNWQTFDLGMQINQAMFAVNGRCGYILKPERMRNSNIEHATFTKSPTQTLEVQIISAQQLPRPKEAIKGDIVDPFVEVELLVPGVDIIKKRTKTILDNGFNPIWNETLTFTIDFEYLELVFLRFVVLREDTTVRTEFIASYCIPVASLQQGYRHIPLNDASGEQYLFTTLFVHLSLAPAQN